jgi:GTPase SAR1 family protein
MENLLEAAAQFINTTSGHIFLTGKAGTGKTTFLKELKNVTHKSIIVVAPTGIAALNAGGVTIHSQFLLPPVTFLPDRFLQEGFTEGGKFLNQNVLARKHPLNSARKQVLRSIDLLVIDEVSMLRADLLDAIDYRMKAARGNFKQSFGGVQVLFIGDLYQLPPVVRKEEQSVLGNYYRSPWFYEAKALQEDRPVYIELDKIFRQHDQEFIDVLNNLRNNSATESDIALLNQHYKEPAEIKELKEVITLTTHNYKADEINKRELQNLSSESHFFEANVEGDFLESMNPVPQRIELKENAQVMFVRNDTSEEKKYFNGKLATVKRISEGNIFVELADTHELYMLRKERWENKKYTVNTATNDLDEDVIGSFEQFPVKLAWAITVHKSQGLTFDKAIIDVDQAFAGGQVYVALSRLRSLDGLILRSKINSSVISTDKEVVAFAKANHKPEGLSEVMKSKQREFLQRLLNHTFDFSLLAKDITYIQKDQDAEGFNEESMKPVLVQLLSALETEQSNTENFRRQLSGLLASGDHTKLLERLEKGSAYYRTLINKWINQLLEHIESTKLQKRVKAYLNQLDELDITFTKKLAEIDKALLLTAGILQGNLKFDFLSLNKQRAEERMNMLSKINKELDANPPAGVKRKKGSKSKKRKKDEPSTYEVTQEMVNNGMTVEQIAEERGLAVGTIEGHFAKLVESGELLITKFLQEEEVTEITNAIKELPAEFTSKDLYEKFKGKYGYGKLRAVIVNAKNDDQQKS